MCGAHVGSIPTGSIFAKKCSKCSKPAGCMATRDASHLIVDECVAHTWVRSPPGAFLPKNAANAANQPVVWQPVMRVTLLSTNVWRTRGFDPHREHFCQKMQQMQQTSRLYGNP